MGHLDLTSREPHPRHRWPAQCRQVHLFNALTRNDVLAANYAFATIEPNIGVVPLPDERLGVLARIFGSAKVVSATVSFVDIAGLVAGASEGAGLGNKFLVHIREANAICQVVRVFDDPDVIHVEGRVDPAEDIATLETELVLADLQTLDRALPRLEKEARTHPRERRAPLQAAQAAREVLDGGRTLFSAGSALDLAPLTELSLLTTKPFLYVFNADEGVLTDADRQTELHKLVAPADAVFLDAKVESELLELDEASAAELLDSLRVGLIQQTDTPGKLSDLRRIGRLGAPHQRSEPFRVTGCCVV